MMYVDQRSFRRAQPRPVATGVCRRDHLGESGDVKSHDLRPVFVRLETYQQKVFAKKKAVDSSMSSCIVPPAECLFVGTDLRAVLPGRLGIDTIFELDCAFAIVRRRKATMPKNHRCSTFRALYHKQRSFAVRAAQRCGSDRGYVYVRLVSKGRFGRVDIPVLGDRRVRRRATPQRRVVTGQPVGVAVYGRTIRARLRYGQAGCQNCQHQKISHSMSPIVIFTAGLLSTRPRSENSTAFHPPREAVHRPAVTREASRRSRAIACRQGIARQCPRDAA